MQNHLPKRKNLRLKEFDYNKQGAYFITICTNERRDILSHIVGGDVLDAPRQIKLSYYGKIAEKYINELNNFYDEIRVDNYIIMPDHIHLMLIIDSGGASRTSPPTNVSKQHSIVSRFVSTFKRFCNKEYGINIWQRSFNDHIIRNEEDYTKHLNYILGNPIKKDLSD